MTFLSRALGVPSRFNHPLYTIEKFSHLDNYGWTTEEKRVFTSDPDRAKLVSSQIKGSDDHSVMLDLDVPASLLPSSTDGHSHLYIDVDMPWRKYRRLLKALARAGVIEKGYYVASRKRKHTSLRLPHIRKEGADQ